MSSFAEFHEEQFREGTMRIVFNMVLVSIALLAGNTALAQQQLPPVEVTASTLGGAGASVLVPFYMMQYMQVKKNTNVAVIADYVTPLSQTQVCSNLKKAQPAGCSMGTYPAAPGLPSAQGLSFSGNGCGADAFSSFIGDQLLAAFANGYSGNLNRPVAGDKAIDFTNACNDHDGCYTSLITKGKCDSRLGQNLLSICGNAASDFVSTCNSFASYYTLAVTKEGDAAYQEDQKDLQCSSWGNSMKANGC
jgi:hypothetical protein